MFLTLIISVPSLDKSHCWKCPKFLNKLNTPNKSRQETNLISINSTNLFYLYGTTVTKIRIHIQFKNSYVIVSYIKQNARKFSYKMTIKWWVSKYYSRFYNILHDVQCVKIYVLSLAESKVKSVTFQKPWQSFQNSQQCDVYGPRYSTMYQVKFVEDSL